MIIRAEIDESANRTLWSDNAGNRLFIQTVLDGDHITILREVRFQGLGRGCRVLAFHTEQDFTKTAVQGRRCGGLKGCCELVERPSDGEASFVHSVDMVRDEIDHQYWPASPRQIGANGAADGPRAPDQDRSFVRLYRHVHLPG